MTALATARSHQPTARRRVRGLVVVAALLVLAVIASLCVGATSIPPRILWQALHQRWSVTGVDVDPVVNQAAIIVQTLRIPRTILALLAGSALGTAGALAQGHTRNPIAEPGLMGISAGASFCIAFGIAVLGLQSPLAHVWLSLLGGLATAALVFTIGNIGRGGSPLTLVLLGAGITATLSSVTSALTLLDQSTSEQMRRWVVGSVAGRGWDVLWATGPLILLTLVAAFATAPTLNLLGLGDDVARGAGVRVERARIVGLTVLAVLTGAATTACGPIALLGLVVPHLARTITGPDNRWLLPWSALLGALVLLVCDVLGRVMATAEVPAGLVVALAGGPFFIAVVRRRRLATL